MYKLDLEVFTVPALVELHNYFVSIINSGEYIANADSILEYQVGIVDDELTKRGLDVSKFVQINRE